MRIVTDIRSALQAACCVLLVVLTIVGGVANSDAVELPFEQLFLRPVEGVADRRCQVLSIVLRQRAISVLGSVLPARREPLARLPPGGSTYPCHEPARAGALRIRKPTAWR